MLYDRFTDRAKKTMAYARQEAQRFNHDYIGTEHILLGLIREGGVAANVLRNLGVDIEKICLEVEKRVQSSPDVQTRGQPPFTPRAKRVIEFSLEEARALGHNYIGTEHILLGLLRENEGVAAQVLVSVLVSLGVKLEDVRQEVRALHGADAQAQAGRVSEAAGGKDSQPVLSLFFPCYNDAGTIASLVALADLTARGLTDRYEVIIIDDGSSDHSRAILKSLEPRYPRLRLILHEQNRGYGGALRSGFAAARGEWVFYTDGDYQYDVDDLRLLWRKAGPQVDIVNGYKVKRHDPLYRVWIGLLYQHFIQLAFGLKIRDVDCDFRLIRGAALRRFRLMEDTGCICIELVKKLQETGARFEEVGVRHMFRAYGHSQFFNFRRIFRTLWRLWRLWIKLVVRKELDRTAAPGI